MPELVLSRLAVKRPPLWRRLFRAAGFAVQLMLAVGTASYAAHYYQIATRLQEALAEMDRTDPGWRLPDVEAARAQFPDAENSALCVLEAEKRLPEKWLDEDLSQLFTHIRPEKRIDPSDLAHLRETIQKLRPALEAARRLQDLPHGRFPIVYRPFPLNTLVAGEQRAREVCALLQFDAMVSDEDGDGCAGLTSCRAALNTGRSLGDEPFAISQLIRLACVMMTCKSVGRTLAQTEPEPSDLKEMQALLEDESTNPYWRIIFRGERALTEAGLEAQESGETGEFKWANTQPTWKDWFLTLTYADRVRAYHPRLFTYTARIKAAAELPAVLRAEAMRQIEVKTAQGGQNPVTVLSCNFSKLTGAIARCQAMVLCHAVALAAERYRREHGDWPQTLDHLTPNFLTAVPDDPYTGESLRYRRLADGIVIYSVGQDGEDDGGNVDMVNITETGTDIGVRLWDCEKRRQPPAPQVPRLPG